MLNLKSSEMNAYAVIVEWDSFYGLLLVFQFLIFFRGCLYSLIDLQRDRVCLTLNKIIQPG